MKKSIVLFFISFLVARKAGAQFTQAARGIQYLIVPSGAGEPVKEGNYVEIHFDQVYQAYDMDTLLFDTRQSAPTIAEFNPNTTPAVFYAIFSGVRKGDSLVIKQSTDSLMLQSDLPPFMKKGNYITGHYKIMNIYETREEADSALFLQQANKRTKDSLERAAQMILDTVIIEKYLAENHIKTIRAPQGTYVQIIKQGAGPVAGKGKTIKLFYTGRTLPGEIVFDSNTDPAFKHTAVFSFIMPEQDGSSSSVIAGFSDGISLLQEGAVAKLFIPSVLAYGKTGHSELIQPNQNLCFDVRIAKVLTSAPQKKSSKPKRLAAGKTKR